jgi:hypothetical protein
VEKSRGNTKKEATDSSRESQGFIEKMVFIEKMAFKLDMKFSRRMCELGSWEEGRKDQGRF